MRRIALLASAVLLTSLTLNSAGAAPKPRVIVVGWDGADWGLLDPLLQHGRLPHLKALIEKGTAANLATYRPRASPLLWTTMATGLTPLEHGVADFQEFDVAAGTSLPVSGRSRKGPAIWNVASARGYSVGIVGWWATWPAEAVKGFFVSDRAAPVLFDTATLSQSPGLTWPPELADGVRLVGRREGQPPYEDVSRFLHVTKAEFGAAVTADQDLQNPITGFRKILGSTRVYARTALDLYDRNKPELLMVYFEGTDEIGHVLGRYHPPRLENVSPADFEKYKDAVSLFYEECDRFLGELAKRAERDGATLILVSDHGFKWGENRPSLVSSIQAETAYLWHEPTGILVLAGPGAARSAGRKSASVFDITPLLCRLLGLPPDPRMPGKVPAGFLAAMVPPARPAVRWDRAFTVQRAKIVRNLAAEKKAGQEFTKKLVSLGYLTGSSSPSAAVAADAGGGDVRLTPFGVSNLGVYLAEQGRVADSLPYFEKAIAADPKVPTFHENLADALEKIGRMDEADREAIQVAILGGDDGTDHLLARAVKRMQAKKDAPALGLLEKAIREIRPARPALEDALGRLYFDRHRCREALPIFEGLSVSTPRDPGAWLMLGRCRRCLGDAGGAREALEKAAGLGANPETVHREMTAIEGSR
jgi:Flp pilus assembly protein TadD/arylsulfatase A-like enzyme